MGQIGLGALKKYVSIQKMGIHFSAIISKYHAILQISKDLAHF